MFILRQLPLFGSSESSPEPEQANCHPSKPHQSGLWCGLATRADGLASKPKREREPKRVNDMRVESEQVKLVQLLPIRKSHSFTHSLQPLCLLFGFTHFWAGTPLTSQQKKIALFMFGDQTRSESSSGPSEQQRSKWRLFSIYTASDITLSVSRSHSYSCNPRC